MKCPEGTVEVAVWVDGIYFDEKHNVEDEDGILNIRNDTYAPQEDKALYKKLRDALKPVMDLTGPNWHTHNNEIWLFTPEEFETLTEGIYHEMPDREED